MPRKRRYTKRKLWRGRPPTKEGWIRTGKITGAHDGVVFYVYQGPLGPRSNWIPIKLCAIPSAPDKGNYFLSWTYGDAKEGKARFARTHEAELLFDYRQDVYVALHARLMDTPLEVQIGLVPPSNNPLIIF